ncbi:MAG TPA: methyltransferase domain-containing protein, partial [Gaiellaceae bacterium]|nr:methyltransferase domain-containing protein [Gaiellaceae bacterium]
FASGEREIARTLRRVRVGREAALDFGCGVGRLTQALASRFDRVVGVDVSVRMVEIARRLNSYDNVEYVVNAEPALPFPDESFDFVYSMVVLQHMPPALGRGYIAELVRMLRAGGTLVFQVPDARMPIPRLPRSAVRATIVPDVSSVQAPPGAETTVDVTVRNDSRRWWPSASGAQMLFLGNHWLTEAGDVLVQDDGRAPLPRDVGPGEEVEVALRARVPGEPGRYVLELDLVQQDVAWFSRRRKLSFRRTRTARVTVEVGDFPPPPERPRAEGGAQMEMHAIPRAKVEAALGDAKLVRVHEDQAAGDGWRSLRYWVTK